jgi:hypothetical protein
MACIGAVRASTHCRDGNRRRFDGRYRRVYDSLVANWECVCTSALLEKTQCRVLCSDRVGISPKVVLK